MKSLLPGFLVAAACALTVSAARAASFDFQTPGQYAANFRTIAAQAYQPSQTTNVTGNNFVTQGYNSYANMVYDATPGDGTATQNTFTVTPGGPAFTFSADISFQAATSSFGILLISPTNEASAYLGIFNVDASGTNDEMRFATNANPTNDGAGTLTGALSTQSAMSTSPDNAIVFSTLNFTYSVSAGDIGQMTMSMTNGAYTFTESLTGITSPLTTFETGLRLSPQGSDSQGLRFDNVNFNVGSSVPEPASLSILTLGALGLLSRRRKYNRLNG